MQPLWCNNKHSQTIKVQDIGGPSFYYGHLLSLCTSGFIATSSYYTTLEYDECIVVFSKFVKMSSKVQNIWRYEKEVVYLNNQLLESFSKMF
jgi:hypothetical protein